MESGGELDTMTKETAASARRNATPKYEVYPSFSLTALTLLDMGVDVDLEGDAKLDLFYGATISSPIKIAKNRYAFISVANAGKTKPDTDDAATYIQAKYGVIIGVNSDDDEVIIRAAKECAKTAIWGRFSIWYSATAAQTPVILPPLPLMPEGVEIDDRLDDDEDAPGIEVNASGNEPKRG